MDQQLSRGVDVAPQRTAILDAALDLLRSEGAAGLRLRTVAARAGCSTTGVYTWFGGKDGLVEAIYLDGFAGFGEALRARWERSGREERLVELAREYRGWALANPTHFQVMFGGLVTGFVPSDPARTFALTTFQVLVDAVADALGDGHLRDGDPAEIAYHLWASIHGYVVLELGGTHQTIDEADDVLYERGLARLMSGLGSTAADR